MKLYTAKAVAGWLDLTESRVRQLRKEKIITERRPGLFELKAVVREYIGYLRGGGGESVDYNAERAKLVRAKRESEELELKVRRGELHEAEEMERVMADALVRFKTRLEAVPASLSPILAKKKDQSEIFAIMKRALDEALDDLSDFKGAFGRREGEDGAENG